MSFNRDWEGQGGQKGPSVPHNKDMNKTVKSITTTKATTTNNSNNNKTKKKKKKVSKFSQLMSGEQIPSVQQQQEEEKEKGGGTKMSTAFIKNERINYGSWNDRNNVDGEEGVVVGREKNNSSSWSIQWKKKGIFNKKLQAIRASKTTTTSDIDKDIEFHSCTLPDDENKHYCQELLFHDSNSPSSSKKSMNILVGGGEPKLSSTSTRIITRTTPSSPPDIPPVLHNKREIYHIPSLLSKNQVTQILDLVKLHIQKEQQQQQQQEGQELDKFSSSSSSSSQCFVAIEDGVPQYYCDDSTNNINASDDANNDDDDENSLISFLLPILSEQVIPISRELCNAPNMVISDALIRWYGVDKSSTSELSSSSSSSSSVVEALAPHYDVSSYASMIIPLNPEECEGGLYVQYGASSHTRHDVSSSFPNVVQDSSSNPTTVGGTSGDAILHRYDVMHGVKFRGGPRYSLVIWMTEDLKSCSSGFAPWIAREADCGMSVHAAFLQGLYSKDGLYGVTKSMDGAIRYWEWAAERGHGLSQYSLSMLLIKLGRCESEREKKKIVTLLEESAETGLDLAQHELATIYKQGYFGVEKNEETAIFWYSKAAEQGYKRSIENLMRYQGRG